ncbi:MAG: FAD-dependent oxidoreductase, partial [Bacillota bacterium]
NNVTVLFLSEIAGLLVNNKTIKGIMIANKFGLQIIRGKFFVDATENNRLALLIKERLNKSEENNLAFYTLEYKDVDIPSKNEIKVPEKLEIYQNKINLHHGKLEPGHLFIEFAFEVSKKDELLEKNKIEWKGRNKAIHLAEYLKKQNHFSDSLLSQMSFETVLTNEKSVNKNIMNVITSNLYSNLYYFSTTTLIGEFSCLDLFNLKNKVKEIVKNIDTGLNTFEEINYLKENNKAIIKSKNTEIPITECNLSKINTYQMNLNIEKIEFDILEYLNVRDKCQILIAGGGTGGAPAAIAASQANKEVIMIEEFSDLGGTQTLGFIGSYYYGYTGGFTSIFDNKVKSLQKKINSSWLIAKMLTYELEFMNNDGKLYTNTVVSDSIVENNRVKGVMTVNEEGMFLIKAKVTVDATGDGDVAVFSGAEYEIGDPRDGSIQDYSQRGKGTGGTGDLDVINNDKLSEYMRGIYISHQKSKYYEFSPILTVRESRRIIGDYYLDLVDVLEERHFEDTIAIARTDSDQHGTMSSWLARMGYEPYHGEVKEVEIPYRSCLVKGMDSILLGAKAISGSKDGVAFTRMASDIQNKGYAIGLAAVKALKQDGNVRKININELQTVLKNQETIPHRIFNKSSKTRPNIKKRINNLKTGNFQSLLSVITLPEKPTLELLKKEYNNCLDKDIKVKLAKAMAWFGSGKGIRLLNKRLEVLNRREGKLDYKDQHPSHPGNGQGGIIDEIDDYWRINQLLVVLGIVADKKSINFIYPLVEKANAGGKPESKVNDYVRKRIDLQRIPHYDRILNLCFCVERLADEKFISPLETLLSKPYMSGYISDNNLEAGKNYINANMEIRAARTLARCGGKKGVKVLAEYLNDVHAILVDHAYQELKEITDKDFGLDDESWNEWLETKEKLDTTPYLRRDYIF